MRLKCLLPTWLRVCLIGLVALPSLVIAQTWNPNIGWKDSYAVGGKCYCDSNGYDHNLDSKSADTPIGRLNVVTICEDIERVLGEGPQPGRIPYNDIQCGNGPANDAADETGCPGRVDIGPAGCDQIGPKWDLETVYANTPIPPRPESGLDRSDWVLSASHNNGEVARMIDGASSTRWATRTVQSPGQYLVIDLGAPKSVSRMVLDSSDSPNDYPRSYSVFVSTDGINWGNAIANGVGVGAMTTINMARQTQRYIKITQTGNDSRYWWSVHELNLFDIEPSTPKPSTPNENTQAPMTPVVDLLLQGT